MDTILKSYEIVFKKRYYHITRHEEGQLTILALLHAQLYPLLEDIALNSVEPDSIHERHKNDTEDSGKTTR
jgi:hypothetical protein